mmetsp:Transcript_24009/g.73553  ORF Transcript_24009/g.73553 Transcript_24009/m.73553 type:complete len:85 (+) Transcript_24009:304-558(+)
MLRNKNTFLRNFTFYLPRPPSFALSIITMTPHHIGCTGAWLLTAHDDFLRFVALLVQRVRARPMPYNICDGAKTECVPLRALSS